MVILPELRGLTQARRLSEAPLMAREWIAVTTGTPLADVAVEVTTVKVAGVGDVQQRADQLVHVREQAEHAAAEALKMAARFVHELRVADVPVRDAATLLGLSPQRISQLDSIGS
ncbi:MAG: HicB family toxin-antitoxin system [Mycobacterium sp.]|nr:MAG: HicB family toxin-antitoxin system [Mycobacterium sp.]